MDYIYNESHDERYSHIHPEDRWMYPDAVRIGPFVFRREKNYADLTPEDIRKLGDLGDSLLVAKDVPITKSLIH